MNFLVTAFLLVLGGILLVLGLNSTESIHDDLSHLAIVHYTNRTIWLIVSGASCCLLGIVGIFRRHSA